MDARDLCILWMEGMDDLDYGLMAVDWITSLKAGTTLDKEGIEAFTDWVLANRCPERVLRKAA